MSFKELQEYVKFGPRDAEVLRLALPDLEDVFPSVSEKFYEAIDGSAGARSVIQDSAQRDRLKQTLVRWMFELLTGPHDDAYFEKRMRIGRVHVRVGLRQRYVMAAMNVLRTELGRSADERLGDGAAEFRIALSKMMDIELAIMLESFIDVSSQEELAEFRNTILSHLPISAFVLDGDGRVVDANPRHRILLAKPSVIDEQITAVLDPAFLAASDFVLQLARCRSARNAIVLPRVDVKHVGRTASYRITLIPVNQAVAKTLLHIEDLTDAIETEARQRQEESLIRLGTMAATVAHEIRNPLAGISAAIQVVRNSLEGTDGRRVPLQKVNEQVSRLGDLVGDLLTFARPVRSQSLHIDLRSVVDQVATQYLSPDGGSATVTGTGAAIADGALLAQSLGNLISNAWQAEATSVKVEVEDGLVRVRDDGPGIPEENHESIFEPFFTTKTRGTGLGLPYSKKSVEQMGGSLRVATDEGNGAVFEIRLIVPSPVSSADAGTAGEKSAPTSPTDAPSETAEPALSDSDGASKTVDRAEE